MPSLFNEHIRSPRNNYFIECVQFCHTNCDFQNKLSEYDICLIICEINKGGVRNVFPYDK